MAIYLTEARMKEPNGGGGHDAPVEQNHRAEPVEIWRARSLIRDQAGEPISLRELAAAVNISPNYLSEKFKQVTGENFVAYVNRHRIEKARELLNHRELRISEIAFAVGFQSLSQFNRIFRRVTRVSPTQYRRDFFGKNA
jgi:AraC-like DNA-binding protein